MFLQKRNHIDLSEPAWVQLGESANGFAINRYFSDHPEMVLGVQTSENTQYGRQDFTVAPMEGASLENQLAAAIQNIQGVYTEAAPADVEDAEADDSIPADPAVRNYSYTVVDGKVYYRENMLQLGDGGEEVILMEPLKKGTAWTLEDGSTRSITGVNTDIKTPIGNFSCIEVITEGKNGMTIDYYAKDIGLVKTIFQSEGMEVSSTLMSMVEDAARKQTVRFY